jgi:putative FmdB family regulatory protein
MDECEVNMPIYEYVCQDCEQVFETLRSMSQADEPMPCAACGGGHTKRKLSVFFAESGGRSVSGMSEPSCGSCAGGNCAQCGH